MTLLVLGLVLFLGAHSVRVLADGWREGFISRRGAGPWKGLYTLVSLAGFGLIIFGYSQARGGAALIAEPAALRGPAMGLIMLGFICVVAAYWPANHIKRLLGDPMVFGVGLWATGHLLVKTNPAALALFGAFLVWAVVDYISLRTRATRAGAAAAPAKVLNTILTVIVGAGVAVVFVRFLHRLLIGVAPVG